MNIGTDASRDPRYLSLRWKTLIALSLILLLVNASLAVLAYRQSAGQFELQQSSVREQQARQFDALLTDGYQSLSKLASFVPLLESAEPEEPTDTLASHLQRVLDRHGAMLDLEWDVRSVQLVASDGTPLATWPAAAGDLPEDLRVCTRWSSI